MKGSSVSPGYPATAAANAQTSTLAAGTADGTFAATFSPT
jgi:hypothetical protein